MIFDTDILIWLFRGNEKAARLVDRTEERRISVVTYMELLQGARNRQEVRQIKTFLSYTAFEVLPLSENIGHRASIYMEEYGLKTAMGVADAIIAATAVERDSSLCTGNQRHYKSIVELEIKVFRP
jgi:predicted nucleic acid-binding protein